MKSQSIKVTPSNYVPNAKDLAALVHRYNTLSALIKRETDELEKLGKSITSYVNSLETRFYGNSKKSETK